MGRNRVLSFMSQFSGNHNRDSKTPSPTSSPPHDFSSPPSTAPQKPETTESFAVASAPSAIAPAPAPYPAPAPFLHATTTTATTSTRPDSLPAQPSTPAPSSPVRAEFTPSPANNGSYSPQGASPSRRRSTSRPLSMVQAYQPPLMDVTQDTLPELQPIFTFLNSHANKLYQEGYFLKLDDQNTQGKPNPDRTWTECFAQLVGTVLSLWDAAELDAAGEDGEVLPKFINLTDASIKMIETLPTRSAQEQDLKNILSLSTAGRNRYLLHFNSHHSLLQWTAAIRLAIYEHSTLQEAYTGALIAGKGKTLNSINVIMERSRLKSEEWVRVRFGAGVPWRRCWCVITPPDEKEYQKQMKELKKRSPYDRSHPPVLKGDIRFYDSKKEGKKQKKARPIASITDAFSAYSIYPQAKSLIDASTLIKVEGNVTIHSDPPNESEGFVFIMPEVHPAVSGFEIMLRFLFPTWDTFALYGRPGRLVASVLDPRSLMFAMPKSKRYGYLETLDVTGLLLTEGSATWTEREWRRRMKDLTGRRMNAMDENEAGSKTHSRTNSRRSVRLSFGGPSSSNLMGAGAASAMKATPRVGFTADDGSERSSRSVAMQEPGARTDSAPPSMDRERAPLALRSGPPHSHSRNASDPHVPTDLMPGGMDGPGGGPGGGMMGPGGYGGQAQPHGQYRGPSPTRGALANKPYMQSELSPTPERLSSDEEQHNTARSTPVSELEEMRNLRTPEPVQAPPAFAHGPASRPGGKPYHSPDLRRANSRLSSSTLAQMANAGNVVIAADAYHEEARRSGEENRAPSRQGGGPPPPLPYGGNMPPGMMKGSNNNSPSSSREALVPPGAGSSPGLPPPSMPLNQKRSKSPLGQSFLPPGAGGPNGPMQMPGPRSGTPDNRGYPNYVNDAMPNNNNFAQSAAYHAYNPAGADNRRPSEPLPALDTGHPIHRKPLPQRTTSLQRHDEATPQSGSSASSFQGYGARIDEAGLNQVHVVPGRQIARNASERSGASSRYDDGSSTTSPDYASTHHSSENGDAAAMADRPRAGVLRSVGGAEMGPMQPGQGGYGVPDFDFGRTVNYGAPNLPRSKTPTPMNVAGAGPGGGQPRPYSPAFKPQDAMHHRQESDDTIRRMPWHPGGSAPGAGGAGGSAVTPEEFVQQRAAVAAQPQYGHQRVPSGGNVLGNSGRATPGGGPAPPLHRAPTPNDYMSQSHSRTSSAELLAQRPRSQGTDAALVMYGQSGSGNFSSTLSAREQEHVARATGSPLINVGPNPANRPPPFGAPAGPGLVGALEAREREKLQLKQAGLGGPAVKNAISQQRQAQQAAQFAYAGSMQQQQQQQQAFPSPVLYGQGPPSAGPGSPVIPPPQGGYSNLSRPPPPGGQQQPMSPSPRLGGPGGMMTPPPMRSPMMMTGGGPGFGQGPPPPGSPMGPPPPHHQGGGVVSYAGPTPPRFIPPQGPYGPPPQGGGPMMQGPPTPGRGPMPMQQQQQQQHQQQQQQQGYSAYQGQGRAF